MGWKRSGWAAMARCRASPLARLEIVRAARLEQAQPLLPETLKFSMDGQAALGREISTAQTQSHRAQLFGHAAASGCRLVVWTWSAHSVER